MTALGLDGFSKTTDFLIGIDSDGCVFDSMEIKHKECFIPMFVKHFGLQAVSKFAREAAEFSNLYSKSRGLNRFVSYTEALDLLENWPDATRRMEIPRMQGLRDWVKAQTDAGAALGNPTLSEAVNGSDDQDLKDSLAWSLAVNDMIADMVHGVPPFPGVKDALAAMSAKADCIVCSATPNEALAKEWDEHGCGQYVQAICGQEAGSKKASLTACKDHGYEPDKMLMIGDAPGDMRAAQAVGCLYYPINPGAEEESWRRFNDESLGKFFDGTFAGAYQEQVIAELEDYLPELPPWKKQVPAAG